MSFILRIGDIISIRYAKPNEGLLTSENLLSDACILSRVAPTFENCLWEVNVQHQYNAQHVFGEKLLDLAALNQYEDEEKLFDADSHKKELKEYAKVAMNESRLNEKLMSLKIGKPVMFGDVIQLKHVKSRKFLTASMSMLAKQERENMRVSLEEHGDVMSWLEFVPKFKFDKEGNTICNESEVFIRIHERPSEFIHAARKASRADINGSREINCSLDSSTWTINIFQQVKDTLTNNILFGNLVVLQDSESHSYLTLDDQKPGITKSAKVIMTNPLLLSSTSPESNVGSNLLWMIESSDSFHGGKVVNRQNVHLRDVTTGLYMKVENSCLTGVCERDESTPLNIFTNQHVESSPISDGSLITFLHEESFITSHLLDGSVAIKHEQPVYCSFIVSTKLQASIGPQIFVGIDACNILRKFVRFTECKDITQLSIVQIENEFKALFACLNYLIDFLVQSLQTEKDSENFSSLYHHTRANWSKQSLRMKQTMLREQGVVDVLIDIMELCELEFFLSLCSYASGKGASLNNAKSTIIPTSDSFLQPSRSMSREDNNFLEVDENDDEDLTENAASPEGEPNLSVARNSLRISISNSFNKNTFASISSRKTHPTPKNLKLTSARPESINICYETMNSCLHVLLLIIRDNHRNIMYIADKLSLLLRQVENHDLSIFCIQEMLKENLEMLQTRIKEDETRIFLNMLQDSAMNVAVMKLVRHLCACPNGVDNTQALLAASIFKNTDLRPSNTQSKFQNPHTALTIPGSHVSTKFVPKDYSSVLITLIEESSELQTVAWSVDKKIYIPPAHERIEIFGLDLLGNAVPNIYVQWDMASNDFSMMTLFGCSDRVSIRSLCNISRNEGLDRRNSKYVPSMNLSPKKLRQNPSTNNLRRASTRRRMTHHNPLGKKLKKLNKKSANDILQRKQQVAKYFIAQLYLCADLCLDRNYFAISLLEKTYTFDILITMVKLPDVPNSFKAPVCRMLRCLYVDRDPQVEAKYPQLIRINTPTLTGSQKSKLSNSVTPFTFCVLQQIISEYLYNELDATKCDDLTCEMIALLLSLIKFGFYKTREQLVDIMTPLIRFLDERRNNTLAPAFTKNKTGYFGDEGSMKIGDIARQESLDLKQATSFSFDVARLRKGLHFNLFIAESSALPSNDNNQLDHSYRDPNNWMVQTIDFLHSEYCLLCLCFFIFLSTSASIILLLQFNVLIFRIIDIIVTISFVVELFIRLTLSTYLKRNEEYTLDYNVVDICVVLVDIVLLILVESFYRSWHPHTFTILRIFRLIRILRTYRVVKIITERAKNSIEWQSPTRYNFMTEHESRAIGTVLQAISAVSDIVQDKKLDSCMRAFTIWFDSEEAGRHLDPNSVYSAVINEDAEFWNMIPSRFENSLTDVMMYSDSTLVQHALNLLMIHKSKDVLHFHYMGNVQLLHTEVIVEKYKRIIENQRFVKQCAENFEIWRDYADDDSINTANNLLMKISEIYSSLFKSTHPKLLDSDPSMLEDVEIQQILLNTNAITDIMSLQHAMLDKSIAVIHPKTAEIIIACNKLLCAFVNHNGPNQSIVFKHLDWFLNHLEEGLYSSKVVKSVLSRNRALIKQCPKSIITELLQRITFTKKPEFLDVLIGLTDVIEVGDVGVNAIRNEIGRCITNGQLWCSDSFAGSETMNDGITSISDDQLSPDLKYHVNLLTLIAQCKLGPKLQAIYQLDDLVGRILDERTIFHVKWRLGELLLQLVESKIEFIEASEEMWKFVEDAAKLITSTNVDLGSSFRSGGAETLRFQRAVWIGVVLDVLISFLMDFDVANLSGASHFDNDTSFAVSTRHEDQILHTVSNLGKAVQEFQVKHKDSISSKILRKLEVLLEYISQFTSENYLNVAQESANVIVRGRRSQLAPHKNLSDEIQQVFYRKQFELFVHSITPTEKSLHLQAMHLFEKMPKITDNVQSDVRLEPFVAKISSHLRSAIQRSAAAHHLVKENVSSTVWVLHTLRIILEDAIKMNFEEILDHSKFNAISTVSWFHKVLIDNNIAILCIDLIAVGLDISICVEASKLLTVLLYKSGGNLDLQKAIYSYLIENDSFLFFEQLKEFFEHVNLWCQKSLDADSSIDVRLPHEIVVIELIYQLCNGSFADMKALIGEQNKNSRSVNLFDSIVSLADILSRTESPIATKIVIRLCYASVSILQGPCIQNQEKFVLNTDLLTTLNKLLRSSQPLENYSLAWDNDIQTMKERIIAVLRACIEGQPKESLVVERVQSSVEFNVLNVLIFPAEADESTNVFKDNSNELSLLQASYLVFLQNLNDGSLDFPANMQKKMLNNTAFVYVLWNQQLIKQHFEIPNIAKALSERSKLGILENMNCLSQDMKIYWFIESCKELYLEAEHQIRLKRFGLKDLWKYFSYLTFAMFANVLVMNVLMTVDYKLDPATGQVTLHSATNTLFVLNSLHIAFAIIAVLICIIVKLPVKYAIYKSGRFGSLSSSLLLSLAELHTVWYMVYLVVTILGFLKNYLYLSILLLDFIILDSTSRDVLLAIIKPAKQLFSTFLIMAICLFINAAFVFLYYRTDYIHFGDANTSMYRSFILTLNDGIRAPEGTGQFMVPTSHTRIVMDIITYFVIVVVLKNIFFGIIVNAFGEIRSQKEENEEHRSNRCFICGIDRHEFDKSSSLEDPDFKYHIEVTHNYQHYLYFIMHIWNQNQESDDSLESHIRKCIISNDISWFPIGSHGEGKHEHSSHHALQVLGDVHDDVDGQLLHATVRSTLYENTLDHSTKHHFSTIEEKLLKLHQHRAEIDVSINDQNQQCDVIKELVKDSVTDNLQALKSSIQDIRGSIKIMTDRITIPQLDLSSDKNERILDSDSNRDLPPKASQLVVRGPRIDLIQKANT